MDDTLDMVSLSTHEGARLIFCSAYCIRACAAGNPLDAVPVEFDSDACVFCAGCGRRLDLNGEACIIHGAQCWQERCFLRTVAALQFCALYKWKHGHTLRVTQSPEWQRAIALWHGMPGAGGAELYDRVMNELAE